MDYRKTAEEILQYVGGGKNIVSAAHCATRLRLVIADNKKADKTALENISGVKGVFEASGQLQIILGTGTVNKVFEQFIAAVKAFGANPYLGAVIGMIMINPSLQNAYTVATEGVQAT